MRKNYVPDSVLIVGATSSIAQAMMHEFVRTGIKKVHLVARNGVELQAICNDAGVRFPEVAFTSTTMSLVDPKKISSAVAKFSKELKPECVLIAHGWMPTQQDQQADLKLAYEQLEVTGISPVLWLEGFVTAIPEGIFGIIGSVAGDRGRQSNYLYGASKGLIEKVCEGMQNRFAGVSGKTVVLLKPGPTKSNMTAELDSRGLADTTAVAKKLVKEMLARKPVVYAPAKWRPIMFVIRNLPRAVFNRTDF